MKSHYLAPVLTIGLLLFGANTLAWSQMRLVGPQQRSHIPSCGCDVDRDCSCRPTCSAPPKCDVCQPCRPQLLVRLLSRIDCALQRILPCPRCCRKPSCCSEPACGCGAVMAPPLPRPEPEAEPLQDNDPFTDDQLEPPPVPAAEAGYVAGKPVTTRRNEAEPTAKTSNQKSPLRFLPVDAAPLKGLIPIPRSLLRDKTATTTDCQKCKVHKLAWTEGLR